MIGTVAFTDPQSYQNAVRPAQVEILVSTRGHFQADLTRVELPRVWVQSGRESLARVVHATVNTDRVPLYFLASSEQAAMRHSGMDVSFGEIIAVGTGSTHHHQTNGPCHWATLSLSRAELATASYALVGRELAMPLLTRRLRPNHSMMSRLMTLHRAAQQLSNDNIPLQSEPTRAVEQSLIHAMIMCLADGPSIEKSPTARQHSAIIARFEEMLATNYGRPLYLAEMCVATGASERTLRICCQEHLGMSPLQYLWLRRMHYARRALTLATSAATTVTSIAMDHGFWELGRFSVQYRTLFGELPSVSLHRPSDDPRMSKTRH